MKLQYGLLAMLLGLATPVYAEQANPAEAEEPSSGTTQTTAEQDTAQAEAQPAISSGSVQRSAITTAVENREPADNLDKVTTEIGQLYFFTELRDMSGQLAKHRWEYNGKVMAEMEFNVKGSRWRVWSSKTFMPNWAGDWKVSVINAYGDVISEKTFTYETASAEAASQPAAEPMAPPAESQTPVAPSNMTVQ